MIATAETVAAPTESAAVAEVQYHLVQAIAIAQPANAASADNAMPPAEHLQAVAVPRVQAIAIAQPANAATQTEPLGVPLPHAATSAPPSPDPLASQQSVAFRRGGPVSAEPAIVLKAAAAILEEKSVRTMEIALRPPVTHAQKMHRDSARKPAGHISARVTVV